jgi:hypothetical protein
MLRKQEGVQQQERADPDTARGAPVSEPLADPSQGRRVSVREGEVLTTRGPVRRDQGAPRRLLPPRVRRHRAGGRARRAEPEAEYGPVEVRPVLDLRDPARERATSPTASSARGQPSTPRSCPTGRSGAASVAPSPRCPSASAPTAAAAASRPTGTPSARSSSAPWTTVHPHLLDVDSAKAALTAVPSVLQDSAAGRRRAGANRRVPGAGRLGYGRPVGAGRPQARGASLMLSGATLGRGGVNRESDGCSRRRRSNAVDNQ